MQFRDLYSGRDGGELMELSRGVFRKVDAPLPSRPDLLAVAHGAPRAVVCLLSAASVFDLTDEILRSVQIAVPKGTWPPKIVYPPVEVFTWNPDTFDLGVQALEATHGEPVKFYSPARTVVDLMRPRARTGEPLAHIALRRYLARRDARVGQLIDLSRGLDVLGPVRAAVEC